MMTTNSASPALLPLNHFNLPDPSIQIDSMSNSVVGSSFSLSDALQMLPLELVLRIVDVLALDLRDSAPTRARSLFLISRTVRQSLLPLIYEVVVITVNVAHQIVGWDQRSYGHPALSFVSWLLCTPSAQPRRHVRNLVFCNRLEFYALELRLEASGIASNTMSAPLWSLDNVIVMHPMDARQLKRAGIDAHAAHWLDCIVVGGLGDSIGRDVIKFAAALWQGAPEGRSYIRLLTQPAGNSFSHVQNGRWQDALRSWSGAFQYQELDHHEHEVCKVLEDKRGVFIFIDVGSNDRFGDLSMALLQEIALIFEQDPGAAYHAVLVFSQGEKDIVINDAAQQLQVHCAAQFHKRVWIVRSSADRALIARDPYLGIARAFQQGIDPWDVGKTIAEFMPKDNLPED